MAALVGLTVRTKMPSTAAAGVLAGVTDGMGKNVSWTYGLLTNNAVYTKDVAPNAAAYQAGPAVCRSMW